ncbi:hypothetical protein B0J18DRAFT_233656 [Chaetomium sp. MPI-SDFR-AT-0129]|nr:hypothetical protein B0J18DRAFT_233656 [Chaetomium sp. MPI-SDFR-AT-0129]
MATWGSWSKYDGFSTDGWQSSEPYVEPFLRTLRTHPEILPQSFPKLPIFVFGPVGLLGKVRNIETRGLDEEILACRMAIANNVPPQGEDKTVRFLASTLNISIIYMKAAAEHDEDVRKGVTLTAHDIGMSPTSVKETSHVAGLTSISGIEAFVRNPSKKTTVSLEAVLTRIRRAYICHPPGTAGFLEDLQGMVLRRPNKSGYQPGAICALSPLRHAGFNAGGVLDALNFCYFGRLQMIFAARRGGYLSWKADPDLVRQVHQVIRDLYATGHARLARELVT